MHYVLWMLQIVLIPALSPLGVGIISKLKAKLQRRQGASVLQPYRNMWKLLHKDEVISRDASVVFRVAPYIVLAVMLVVGASIPVFGSFLHTPTADLLTVVYMLALGTFFLALAGMDTGSAFGGFGSSREMTMSALAEGSFILSIVSLVLICGTTNLMGIAGRVGVDYGHALLPILLAFAGFLVVLVAETGRFPFDNVDTHLELTMIHEAMILEYSGKRLAMMEWAAAIKLMIFATLAANVFFPMGIAHSGGAGAVALGLAAWIAKLLVIYAVIALVESSISKYRFFRLPDLLLVAYVFNVFAIGLVR